MTMASLLDVLIIGGGPAGLSAAMTVARALHTAVVFDSHAYRNLLAKNMHAVTTWDHRPPQEFRNTAKSSILSRYSTIRFEDARIDSLKKTDKGIFQLIDENGKEWFGRKLLLATGVKDVYPDINGYGDCWVSGM
jgi:gliotoxin/aspirochlorine biosynthesis thioredoxin reductase